MYNVHHCEEDINGLLILPCLLFKTVTCTAFFDLLVSAKSKIYIYSSHAQGGKHRNHYSAPLHAIHRSKLIVMLAEDMSYVL